MILEKSGDGALDIILEKRDDGALDIILEKGHAVRHNPGDLFPHRENSHPLAGGNCARGGCKGVALRGVWLALLPLRSL